MPQPQMVPQKSASRYRNEETLAASQDGLYGPIANLVSPARQTEYQTLYSRSPLSRAAVLSLDSHCGPRTFQLQLIHRILKL